MLVVAVVLIAGLTVALACGQLYLGARIMGYTFQVYVDKLRILGVAIVIAVSLGVSILSVSKVLGFF